MEEEKREYQKEMKKNVSRRKLFMKERGLFYDAFVVEL
jgi:hypothetical protein